MFCINDLDDALPGLFEWDVRRLVASFAVAGRDRGFDTKQRKAINPEVGHANREGIRRLSAMKTLDLWYFRLDVEELLATLARAMKEKDVKAYRRARRTSLTVAPRTGRRRSGS